MSLDIVIPVWNSIDMTWRAYLHLEHAGDLKAPNTLYIVDDGSSDSTPAFGEYLQKRTHHVYMRHDKNRGCHAAWNTGWRVGTAPYVAFINNDIAVMPRCISTMMRHMEAGRPYVAASQLLGPWDPGACLAHDADAFADRDGLDVGKGAYFNSCFIVRRDILEALDGFDEQFYLVYGDTDFIERLKDAGHQTCIANGAVCYHGGSVTRRREFGKDKDVSLEIADRDRFEKKWGHREDVMQRHPRLPQHVMERARDGYWSRSEEV